MANMMINMPLISIIFDPFAILLVLLTSDSIIWGQTISFAFHTWLMNSEMLTH